MNNSFIKYILALLLFGSNGIIASHISLASYETVLLRTFIGSLFLMALFFITGQRLTFYRHKKDLAAILLSGIAMGTSWMFLYEAYDEIGIGISSLLYYCGPVIVMALSPLLFKEKLTWAKVIGFSCVLSGIILINIQTTGTTKNIWGIACGAASAFMYAAMVITNKKAQFIKGMENSLIQLVSSFLTVALFTALKSGLVINIKSGDWIWILILGIINTGLGCYCYFSSIGRLPVQTVAICGYLEPLSAVLFSAAFLHETLIPLQGIGAALIIGGAVAGEYTSMKSKKQ